MSGIAGLIRFDSAPVTIAQLEVMAAAIRHRGPDGLNYRILSGAGFCHAALHTTDEHRHEQQPLVHQSGRFVLVMDGRLDNRDDVLRALAGKKITPRDTTDAGLVLEAFLALGPSCANCLDGDYAALFYDAETRHITALRDRFGHKPFHYCWTPSFFAFASEPSALLALPDIGRTPDVTLLAEFLGASWQSNSRSFWRDIKRLPPRTIMQASGRGAAGSHYWTGDPDAAAGIRTAPDWIAEYRHLLRGAVGAHMRSHAAVACEASGGLDSSAVFALARNIAEGEGSSAAPVHGFCLDFAGVPAADERLFVQALARFTSAEISPVSPARWSLRTYTERARAVANFPSYPNGVMAMGIRRQAASRGCRVLLTGNGGDEVLAARPGWYAALVRSAEGTEILRVLREDAASAGVFASVARLARRGILPLAPERLKRLLRRSGSIRSSIADWRGWLSPHLRAILESRETETIEPQLSAVLDPFDVHAREFEEALASEAGIELRSPFLTRKVVEHCLRVPMRLREAGGIYKAYHRQAMHGLLPPEILERSGKADFMITMREQLPGLTAGIAGIATSDALDPWLDRKNLQSVLTQSLNPHVDGWPEFMVWTLFGCMCVHGIGDESIAAADRKTI